MGGLTIAELRQSPAAALPERAYSLCLAQALVAEVQSLESEKAALTVEQARGRTGNLSINSGDEDGKSSGPPRRTGQGKDPRVVEIETRLEALWDEMREHTGELRLRGISGGEWRRWVDAHPARKDNTVDENTAYGLCDADALHEDLERYAVSWNGVALGEGDWEFIANRAAPGDLKELCKTVVLMHEGPGASAPGKSPKVSSETTASETASA